VAVTTLGSHSHTKFSLAPVIDRKWRPRHDPKDPRKESEYGGMEFHCSCKNNGGVGEKAEHRRTFKMYHVLDGVHILYIDPEDQRRINSFGTSSNNSISSFFVEILVAG
jgi:hypothetical protein